MKKGLIIGLSIFLGLVLLVAGIGKIPGQTEFIDALLGSFWTPAVAYFIGYCLPWIEVVLGVALMIGVFSRIAAGLCLPLIGGFIASNSWAIINDRVFGQCGCFGVFEKLFGNITPVQALGLDIALFIIALVILIFYPSGFLNFRPWFIKHKGRQIK